MGTGRRPPAGGRGGVMPEPRSPPPGGRGLARRTYYRAQGTALRAPVACFYADRVRARLAYWKGIGASPGLLRQIREGVKINFAGPPPTRLDSPAIPVPREHAAWVRDELERGQRLGVFGPPPEGGERFAAPAFVTVSAGKRRLVHDLRKLNARCVPQSCRYETVGDLEHLLEPGDYMLSSDVKDGYHAVKVHPAHRKFFTFHLILEGQLITLCSYALPFGWSAAPLTFTKFLRPFIQACRARGWKALIYLDDALFAARSYQQALVMRSWLDRHFLAAGLVRHPTKGVWDPVTRLPDHLGYTIDTVANRISVPARRCVALRAQARTLLAEAARKRRWVSTQALRRFAGAATSTSFAVNSARFRLRAVFDCLDGRRPGSKLTRQALTDLQWWVNFDVAHPANGRQIWRSPTTRTIAVDASGETGWGAELLPSDFVPGQEDVAATAPSPDRRALGTWTAAERDRGIAWKELRALHLALQSFRAQVQGQRVHVWEDNMVVCSIVTHGTSRSPELMHELRSLWRLLEQLNVQLVVRYIRSAHNPADRWSRFESRSAWQLCPRLFQRLTKKRCTIDAFADRASAHLPRYAAPTADPGACARDGFSINWGHEFAWLNPPWELIGKCLHKVRADRAKAIIVVPRWRSALWWPQLRALAARWIPLPPPCFSVKRMHSSPVEPFIHPRLRLVAVYLDGGSPKTR